MEQRLSVVTLGVEDLAKSRKFYERLGWKASGVGGDEVVFFQLGGIALALYGRADLTRDAGLPSGGGDGSSCGIALAYNVRRRQDVNAALAEAEKAGATILKPAQDTFWGGYSGFFSDLDGHPWEVAWNPGFKLKADGSVILPP